MVAIKVLFGKYVGLILNSETYWQAVHSIGKCRSGNKSN